MVCGPTLPWDKSKRYKTEIKWDLSQTCHLGSLLTLSLVLSGGLIWERRWIQQHLHKESCRGTMGDPISPMYDFSCRMFADWFLKSAWVVNHATNNSTRKHLQSPLRLSECSPLPKGTRELKCTSPWNSSSHELLKPTLTFMFVFSLSVLPFQI